MPDIPEVEGEDALRLPSQKVERNTIEEMPPRKTDNIRATNSLMDSR